MIDIPTFIISITSDTTPNTFTFVDRTGVERSTLTESNTITVSGIDAAATISISGADGTYSIDGGSSYTSEDGTVNNGASVAVRVTASSSYETTVSTTLTIGGVSDNFSITTESESVSDTTPNPFTFVDRTGIERSALTESNTITVSGIDTATTISISGDDGEYSINGGTFTSETGTVNNGASVKARVTSSSDYDTSVSTTLNIGGVSDSFDVSTLSEIASELVAYFPFNGNANDESGNVNHGTVNGAVLTTDRFGNLNKAYSFDGDNDFIEIQDDDSLDLIDSFTICAWVKPDSIQDNAAIVAKHQGSNNNDGSWELSKSGDHFTFGCFDFNRYYQSNYTFAGSEWIFLTYTYDNSSSAWKFYVNGYLDSSGTQVFSIVNTSYNLLIGAEISRWNTLEQSSFWSGNIDDIRLYNYALTASQINALFYLSN